MKNTKKSTRNKKVQRKKNLFIIKLINIINLLAGTSPMISEKGQKITIVYKNTRMLYVLLLFVLTILFIMYNKYLIIKFTRSIYGCDFEFILKIIATISTMMSTCSCWIGSFAMSKYHLKIVENNREIAGLLTKHRNQFSKINKKMLSSTFIINAALGFTLCLCYHDFEEFDFTDGWYNVLIFFIDWFIIKYIMLELFNINNFQILKIMLKNTYKINHTPSSNIVQIITIFDKLNENSDLVKYITFFPVHIYDKCIIK